MSPADLNEGSRPRIVVIGAGFGGLQCARRLAGEPVEVVLVDRHNYHLFTPLLYQVASALLNPSDIARPVRAIFHGRREVRFRLAEVTGIDFDRHRVRVADGDPIDYDRLVIACGSRANFFGIESVERSAFGLKDLADGMALRNHVLACFEAAVRENDPAIRREWMTFVVVGGGPTGVEYAGALSELFRLVLVDDYPDLEVSNARVVLLEALDRLLPGGFPAELGAYARTELEERGIEVRLGARVTGAADGTVELEDGSSIGARTLVWAAGVQPAGLVEALGVSRGEGGRIAVDACLRVEGTEDVFAVGDAAAVTSDGDVVPMMAPPAMQAGRHAAANVMRSLRGEPLDPFRYHDKGVMATIGRNAGVAAMGRLKLKGFLGWLGWLAVHLYYLIGWRNRFAVLAGWAWDYVRLDRPIRIIARAGDDPTGTAGGGDRSTPPKVPAPPDI